MYVLGSFFALKYKIFTLNYKCNKEERSTMYFLKYNKRINKNKFPARNNTICCSFTGEDNNCFVVHLFWLLGFFFQY